MRTWLRRIGMGVAALVVALAITAAVLAIWIHTDAGHRFIARRFESFVTDQIAGRLRVGGVTDVSLRGVSARDARFSAPDGQDVLVIDDVDLEIRWLSLLAGRFIVPSARVRGGRIVLRDAVGGLDLDLAFRNRHPRSEPPEPDDPSALDVANIDATGLGLFANVHGVPTINVTGLHSTVRVWVPYPGGPTRLSARDIAGHLAIHTPIPIGFAIASGTMRFDGSARDRAAVDLLGLVDGTHVRWTNTIVSGHGGVHVASVLVVPDVGAALRETALIAQASVAEVTTSGFDFSVQIGPTASPSAHRRAR